MLVHSMYHSSQRTLQALAPRLGQGQSLVSGGTLYSTSKHAHEASPQHQHDISFLRIPLIPSTYQIQHADIETGMTNTANVQEPVAAAANTMSMLPQIGQRRRVPVSGHRRYRGGDACE